MTVDISMIFTYLLNTFSRMGEWTFTIWGTTFSVWEWFAACAFFGILLKVLAWFAGLNDGIM